MVIPRKFSKIENESLLTLKKPYNSLTAAGAETTLGESTDKWDKKYYQMINRLVRLFI